MVLFWTLCIDCPCIGVLFYWLIVTAVIGDTKLHVVYVAYSVWLFVAVDVFAQTTLLIVNQNVIDMLASLLMIATASIQVCGTGMDRNSSLDMFICRFWMTRFPLWSMLISSNYSILVLSVERYIAIVHPVFYKVSTSSLCSAFDLTANK